MELLIGCDPEVFVQDTKTGKFVCGEGLIPGDKLSPFPVEGGAVQVDGTALEFNIDPASTRVEFVGNVCRVFDTLKKMVPKHLQLVTQPYALFDRDDFKTFSKKSLMLGCEPDYDAYTGRPNPPPAPDRGNTFRTASGHVHVGWGSGMDPKDPDHITICCEVAKQLDFFVGFPSLFFSTANDERSRRRLYGKAGAFRPKPYGLEYRTPSNAWLRSEAAIGYIYDQTRLALEEFESGRYLPNTFDNVNYYINHPYLERDLFRSLKLNKPPKV